MAVDDVDHSTAAKIVAKMSAINKAGVWRLKLPYQVGAGVALVAGFASFPMVFDLDTAVWFNDNFVTTDMAEEKDLETPLEVNSCHARTCVVKPSFCLKGTKPPGLCRLRRRAAAGGGYDLFLSLFFFPMS